MSRNIHSSSLQAAKEKFPAIRATLNLAEKHKFKVLHHFYKLTKRGAVYQHNFVVLWEWKDENTGEPKSERQTYSNQVLQGMLKNWDNAVKRTKA
jgi:hypothetical protein